MTYRKVVVIAVVLFGLLAVSFLTRCIIYDFDYTKYACWNKEQNSVFITSESEVRPFARRVVARTSYVYRSVFYMIKPWNYIETLIVKSEYKDTDNRVEFLMNMIRKSKVADPSYAIYNYKTGDIFVK
jgi:hypothetical protein